MLGNEMLCCERCGETSAVTLWRFEGLSYRSERAEARMHEPLANSRR